MKIDRVEIEKRVGDIIPDVIVYSKINNEWKRLMVEVFVTHRVDEEKAKKIEAMRIDCVEVSLEQDYDYDDSTLLNELIGKSTAKKWIWNNKWANKIIQERNEKARQERFLREQEEAYQKERARREKERQAATQWDSFVKSNKCSIKKEIFSYPLHTVVSNCPIGIIFNGVKYKALGECNSCLYRGNPAPNQEYVLCNGHFLGDYKIMNIPVQERIDAVESKWGGA